MRNLDECRAEVFRRSEKRIAQRKKHRNRMISVCVPLVLCMAGVIILPKLRTNSPVDVPVTEMVLYQEPSISEPGVVDVMLELSITVSGDGDSVSYAAMEDVEGILAILERITEAPVLAGEATSVTSRDDASDLQSSAKEHSCRITIRRGTEQDAVYTLAGFLLTNETTGKQYYLDEDTCAALKEALGIPLY